MTQERPIIQSLLDLDFYKLTMGQLAWKHFPEVLVVYSFKNRTISVPLAEYIAEEDLQRELAEAQRLTFSLEEIDYLRSLKLFSEDFLSFLWQMRLSEVLVRQDGGQYQIEVSGKWPEAIFWETLILGMVNELYYRSLIKKRNFSPTFLVQEGWQRLVDKIKILQSHPEIRFSDFGTRRRFSRDWQEGIIEFLKETMPDQLLGTSNVRLAKKFGLQPIGTMAHELFMVLSGVFHYNNSAIYASHNKVLELWWEMYGDSLSIALTDTYGTNFFFRDFNKDQAIKWRGLRQDSGDPLVFGERALEFYHQNGINSAEKTLVFSDGLDVKAIVELEEHFRGRIKTVFGWGTNLTNDLGLEPLSLVVKVTKANGSGTVKLSDNLAKATGKPEDIERFKKIFGYASVYNEQCRY